MFYYSQTEGIVRFTKGLNEEQIKKICVWLTYAEKHVTGKVQMAPANSAEKESWRVELHTLELYQSHLRDALLKVMTP